jgi:RNA polymerase sigma-70 factor, ECF subfamily
LETLTEERLIELLQQGHHKALTEVVRRHGTLVAKVVKGMLGDVPEAEDVGQETFIRFWNNIESYRHEAKISTFLVKIAMNLSLNELKRRKNRFSRFGGMKENVEEVMKLQNPPHDEVYGNNQLVEHALASLDTAHRSVVVMRLLQGYSSKETADILNVPLGTVLSRLSRAQDKLRIIIDKTTI